MNIHDISTGSPMDKVQVLQCYLDAKERQINQMEEAIKTAQKELAALRLQALLMDRLDMAR